MNQFSSIDIITVLLYLILVIGISMIAARRNGENTRNYFLAGRNMGWFVIGISLFVTHLSAEHLVGLSSAAAEHGLIVGHFEWMSIVAILLLGFVFGPMFWKAGIYTVPEYIERRFNRISRLYLSGVSILMYMLTKLSVILIAGGLILNALLGWDIYTSAVVMVVITGIYTIVGGMRSVIYTQLIQFVFLVGGGVLVSFLVLNEVGGISGLHNKLPAEYFSLTRPVSDPNFPWTGVLFGLPVIAIWYWCTDQYVVQRVFTAGSVEQIKKASLFTSMLSLLPVILFIIPSMAAVALFPESSLKEIVPVLLADKFLPAGFTGLFLASVFAAVMSSLASIVNSTAALFTLDFYKLINPQASERKMVLIGRLSSMLMVIIAILWIPITKVINTNLYLYLLNIQAFIGPPIAAVFILGLTVKMIHAKAAFITLVAGGGIGLARVILGLVDHYLILNSPLVNWFLNINFLHFAVLLFVFSSALLLILSAVYKKREVQTQLKPILGEISGGFTSQTAVGKKIEEKV